MVLFLNFEVVNQDNEQNLTFKEVCGTFTFKVFTTTLDGLLNALSLAALPNTVQYFYL